MSADTNTPGISEEYITHLSQEIENRVTKKIFQEFSWAENKISSALLRFDKFLLNSQDLVQSGNDPESFRDTGTRNQEPCEDRSQNDHHLEVDDTENRFAHTVTPEPNASLYMVTGVQKEIPYSAPGTSSGKPKNVCSSSQPQIRICNSPAMVEADHNLFASNNWRVTAKTQTSKTT